MKTAWLGSPRVKDAALGLLQRHQRYERLVQGVYWNKHNRHGCYIGCLTHDDGDAYAAAYRLFGLPPLVSAWLEGVFEATNGRRQIGIWASQSLDAIPVQADLRFAFYRFGQWLCEDILPNALHLSGGDSLQTVVEDLGVFYEHRAARGKNLPDFDKTLWSLSRACCRESQREALHCLAYAVRGDAAAPHHASVAVYKLCCTLIPRRIIANKTLRMLKKATVAKRCSATYHEQEQSVQHCRQSLATLL